MSEKALGWARRWGLGGAVAVVLAAAFVAGCGGGGGSSGTTATAFTAGPIRGFGSIIVNGVRFDDSTAQIEDDDGNRGSSADLKLGTMCEIDSDRIDDSTGRAHARHIRFGAAIVGPVESVDVAGSSFVALGQTVDVKPETVLDDSITGGIAGLATGLVVEVHALFDAASGHYIATRIEAEPGALFYKLRGVVSALDTTAKTFQIGAAVISYVNVADADLPAGFANGLKVRVRLSTAQLNGQWVATAIRSGVRKVEDHDDVRLIGSVTTFTSPTSFEVNGIPVDASTARIDNGPVTADSRVEVRGSAKDGTIIATRVTVLNGNDDMLRGVELHGTISAADATAKSFVLRGVKVTYTDATIIRDGTAAQLVDGANVEVKGVLSADRSTLMAVLIDFES